MVILTRYAENLIIVYDNIKKDDRFEALKSLLTTVRFIKPYRNPFYKCTGLR